MKLKCRALVALTLMACPWALSQPARRLAIVEANGQLARSNQVAALAENQLADGVTGQLAGKPGITLIDRASIDRILKEQNFQNSDRSSPDTAVRIGKLLGVGQMVLVNVYDLNYTTHQESSGNTTRTTGTMVLRANLRVIDVETAVILAQPSSDFEESVPVSETSKSQGFQFGAIRVPAKQKTSGDDPNAIKDKEWAKARQTVTADLSAKLVTAFAAAPGPKLESPLVAGIANGSVYINQGSSAGIKAGSKFQVVREVSIGLNDPKTGQPIVQKKRLCVLTIVDVEETNASGTCQGGLPQSKDVAEPMQ